MIAAVGYSGRLPLCAWISKVNRRKDKNGYCVKGNATLHEIDENLELDAGIWLISVTSPKSDHIILNHGSVLVELTSTSRPKDVVIFPFLYDPPEEETDNYAFCQPKDGPYALCFKASALLATDLKLFEQSNTLLETFSDLNQAIAENLISTFGKENELFGYCRDIMLLFPELLVPGWVGIKPQVTLSDRAETNMKKRLQKHLERKIPYPDKIRMLAGTYTLDPNVHYFNEPVDDLAPFHATFFKGDDCDGSSMAAYALFAKMLGENKAFLVSGTALLGANGTHSADPGQPKAVEGHSWVMHRESADGFQMCETTACTADHAHFHTGAFAWTATAAYAFCTLTDGNLSLGVKLQTPNLRLPIKTHEEAKKHNVPHYLCRIEVGTDRENLRKNIYALAHQIRDEPKGDNLSEYIFHGNSKANFTDYPTRAATMGKGFWR